MSDLDNPDLWNTVDAHSMKDMVVSFAQQVRAANDMIAGISLPAGDGIRNVIVAGMGGSAIGGDIARAAVSGQSGVPILVHRDYDLPAFVDSHSLVIASSYSGNTEETLRAYEGARLRSAAIICVTSGGKLAHLARRDDVPAFLMPPGWPPRAALGYSTVAILRSLEAAGLIPDMTAPLRETAVLLGSLALRYRPEVAETENPAKNIARSLHGKLIAVYGSAGTLDAASYRWRCQIEENAKNLALHHVLPEMNHNELVGWQLPADLLGRVGVVLLRDRADHRQVQRRFDLTRELLAGRCGALHEVWTEGDALLARIFSAVYLGDFVSLYMAYLNAIDPTPVAVIEYFKEKLGS
jgi:glucose/mannose-6-phosphate isomerase